MDCMNSSPVFPFIRKCQFSEKWGLSSLLHEWNADSNCHLCCWLSVFYPYIIYYMISFVIVSFIPIFIFVELYRGLFPAHHLLDPYIDSETKQVRVPSALRCCLKMRWNWCQSNRLKMSSENVNVNTKGGLLQANCHFIPRNWTLSQYRVHNNLRAL